MEDIFVRERYNYKGDDMYEAENIFMKGKMQGKK